jgi:hypothetical protein
MDTGSLWRWLLRGVAWSVSYEKLWRKKPSSGAWGSLSLFNHISLIQEYVEFNRLWSLSVLKHHAIWPRTLRKGRAQRKYAYMPQVYKYIFICLIGYQLRHSLGVFPPKRRFQESYTATSTYTSMMKTALWSLLVTREAEKFSKWAHCHLQ